MEPQAVLQKRRARGALETGDRALRLVRQVYTSHRGESCAKV